MNKLPQVGSVWGVPSNPSTWRRVAIIGNYHVWFDEWGGPSFCDHESWAKFVSDEKVEQIFPARATKCNDIITFY